jgi:hypothetical protein
MVPDGPAAAQRERGSGSEWPRACTVRSLRYGTLGATSSGDPSPRPHFYGIGGPRSFTGLVAWGTSF